jgi:RND family efflux transporter MFP subunit
MTRKSAIAAAMAAGLAGYIWGTWNAKPPAQVSAKTTPAVRYYQCPMHPDVRSDKPGRAPCCNMAFVPVYGTEEALPPGAVRVTPEQEQLLGLKFATAKSGVISDSIRALARLGLDETKIAHVQTKLEGYADQVLVKTVGTEVRKGQVLMTIYHPKSAAAQEEYLSAVKAVMERTDARPANAEGLMAAGRLRLELMGFSDPQIETITKAMQPLVRLQVVAPIAGVVTEVSVLPRQKLIPETLYTIADISTIWATADVPSYETAPVAAGQEATLRIPSMPGRQFTATVDSLLPQLDSATHTRKIRARIDNPDRALLPEMYGDLEIRTSTGRRAVLIPRDAVLDRGLRKIVFVEIRPGRLEPREVTAGRSSGDRMEILRGVRSGERVVTSGHFLFDSESRLSVVGQGSRHAQSNP